ncbi:BAR adaptor protein Hob3, partial [Mycoemilia scoparia]
SGFKKSIGRAGTSIKQKVGSVEASNDPDFNEQEERFKILEKKAERLYKESDGYLASVETMTESQRKLAENMTALMDGGQSAHSYQSAYRHAAEYIDEKVRADFESAYRQTVIESISRYCSYIPEFNKGITQRKHRLQDFDKIKAQWKKAYEKQNIEPQIFEKVDSDATYAEQVYNNINTALIREIPKLINARIDVLDPSFEAFIKSQHDFFGQSSEQMDRVQTYLPPRTNDDDRALDNSIRDILERVRGLSICSLSA